MENQNVPPAPVQAQTVVVVKNNFWKGFFVGLLVPVLLFVLWIGVTVFILSSTVNSSLNTARAKGALVSVRSSLAYTRASAEIYYDSHNGSYAGVCEGDTTTVNTLSSLKGMALVSNVVCFADADSWAASAAVKMDDGTFQTACVNSTGASTASVGNNPVTDANSRCQ